METGNAVQHRLEWMPQNAPYTPVAAVGLLSVLARVDPGATLGWQDDGEWTQAHLVLSTRLSLEQVAAAVADAPWPDLDALPWGGKRKQAIKPTLEQQAKRRGERFAAVRTWRDLAGFPVQPSDPPIPATDPGLDAAHRLIAALLTDGAVDDSEMPGRSRLLRGVKADLSGVAKPPKVDANELRSELEQGPRWRSGSSGLGLGFVPQVQTFGGTTGPEPSAVGAYSALLYLLCWHGILAMPPFGARRGKWSVVGGPLFSGADTLSWPTWRMALGLRPLVALFGLDAIHREEPDRKLLGAHDITAVFRSTSRPISTMLSVFGWGDRVA